VHRLVLPLREHAHRHSVILCRCLGGGGVGLPGHAASKSGAQRVVGCRIAAD
jgi:hypothetical protein